MSHGEAWLLDVMHTAQGARVSLCPVGNAATSTLKSYTSIELDFREVERLVYELRVLLGHANMKGQLDESTSAEVRKLGHLLFDELLPASIKTWLREHEGIDLLIRADESLVDLPWEMLHTGESFLALQMNMGRLISTQDARPQAPPRQVRAPYKVLILADPCGDLDAAYEEGIELRDHLDAQTFLQVSLKSSEVSRSYVRENIREFDVLHFAGHAEVAGRGEGWLLSDGRFTVDDVERLTGGKSFPGLVFANACGSGRSGRSTHNHQDTWSLARTFIQAGVRHFVGTHWDLPDEIASGFASHFYRGLCSGLSVGSALRRARLAMSLVHGDGAVLWGSYCLYGDPGYVYFPEALGESHDNDFDLPILDIETEPERARGIYHTIDVPVSDLLSLQENSGPATIRPNASLRNEAVLDRPHSLVGQGVYDLTRALLATGGVASLVVIAVLGWQWAGESTPPEGPPETDPVAMVAPLVDAEPVKEALEPEVMVFDPTEDDLLIQEEAERQAPPRVDFRLTAQTRSSRNDVVEVVVSENTRLRSGDNLRVLLHSERDAYVAMLLLDGKSGVQLLFPHPSVMTESGTHMQAGMDVSLPGTDRWWRLDRQTGVESMVLLASKMPMDELDLIVKKLKAGLKKTRRSRAKKGGLVVRGVGGTTQGKARTHKRLEKPLLTRSHQLADLQAIAFEHGVELVEAVTYIHAR